MVASNGTITTARVSWGPDSTPTYLSSSPFIQEILSRNYRRRDLPDLVASLPPCADGNIPRSNAIDIPGNGGRRREVVVVNSAPASPESIGQELRRIADDFDLSFGASTGRNRTSSFSTTARSRSLSFIQRSRSLSFVSSLL